MNHDPKAATDDLRAELAQPLQPITDAELLQIYWDASWNADGKAPMTPYEMENAETIVRGLRAVRAA